MEHYEITKEQAASIMTLYGHINDKIQAYDETILDTAVHSAPFETMYVSSKLSRLIFYKQRWLELKVLLDDVLMSLDDDTFVILACYFIRQMSMDDITVKLHCSPRTIYRRITTALEAFSKQFSNIAKQFYDIINEVNIDLATYNDGQRTYKANKDWHKNQIKKELKKFEKSL